MAQPHGMPTPQGVHTPAPARGGPRAVGSGRFRRGRSGVRGA